MIFVFLNFLVASIAFVAFFVLITNKNKKEPLNYYFLSILLLLIAQRAFYTSIYLLDLELKQGLTFSVLAYLFIPLYYLFIKSLTNHKISVKENLVNFTLAILLICSHLFFGIKGTYRTILFGIFSTFYLYMLLRNYIIYLEISTLKKTFSSKKKWLSIMVFLIICKYLISNILLITNRKDITIVHENFYNFSAIVWVLALTYLFVNPEILFGVQKLKKIVREDELLNKLVWEENSTKKIALADKQVHEKVVENKLDIIKKIENFTTNYYNKQNTKLTFQKLSEGINVKPYHLNYIIKYYCTLSKNDFLNYCKIRYATQLIEEGYLQRKTVNSLITDTHFSSKKTFYNNFQKFTGQTPYELEKFMKFKM